MRLVVMFCAIALAALLIPAAPASAQPPVSIEFAGGRVTVRAHNAPVRLILEEWSRLGGVTIVNSDHISGGPETLQIVGMPEPYAIDLLLRGVAGYVLAPRRAGVEGASMFDRILILPTSVTRSSVIVAATPPSAPQRAAPPPALLARFGELGAEGRPPSGEDSSAGGVVDPPLVSGPFGPGAEPGTIALPTIRPMGPPEDVVEGDVPNGEAGETDDRPALQVAPPPAKPAAAPTGSSTPGMLVR